MQQAAKIGIVGRFELIRRWTTAKSRYGAANPCGDDEEDGGTGQGAKDEDKKLIHTPMILQWKARGLNRLGGD
jgi:hypothetical protein